jgi:hypothetical protein
MYDWIIEADVYRLRRAAAETRDQSERRELEALADQKLVVLSKRRTWVRGTRSDA